MSAAFMQHNKVDSDEGLPVRLWCARVDRPGQQFTLPCHKKTLAHSMSESCTDSDDEILGGPCIGRVFLE